jgi:pyruvate dehydrogenase E2 component (dihydrolipoamide acetyltransferase)
VFIDSMLAGNVARTLPVLGEAAVSSGQIAQLSDHLAANGGQLRAMASEVSNGDNQVVSILSRLQGLAISVTAVFGRDDRIIPATHALNLPSNVAVHFLAGDSHLPHWRDPDLIVRLVTSAS